MRQLAHVIQGQIAAKCGKRLVKYLPELAGPWLAGAQDSDRGVAKAAQDALKQTFPTPEKLQGLSKVFHQSILEYCRDAVTNETVQTLSDERTVSTDDAEATYARVIGTSLAVISNLLVGLPVEELIKQQDIYDALLGESKLWNFAAYKDVGVRRGLFRLLRASLENERGERVQIWMMDEEIHMLTFKAAVEHNLKPLSTAFIDKALHSDQAGSSLEFLQTLVALTQAYPSIWNSAFTGKKSAISRLRQCVKKGSQGGPAEFWSQLWTLLSKLPVDVLPKTADEAKEFLKSLHDGANSRDERFNAPSAWETYFRTVDLILDNDRNGGQLSEDAQDLVVSEMVLPVIEQYLRPAESRQQWAPAGARPAKTVAKSAYCRALPRVLCQKWPEYASNFVQDIKSSLPEQSKEHDKSQTAIASAGERWSELQAEFTKDTYTLGTSFDQMLKQSAGTIVEECLTLLRARNGKPYGAAAVVDAFMNHCGKWLLSEQSIHSLMFTFLSEHAPAFALSPSQRQLFSLLYHFHGDSKFEEAWNGIATHLMNEPDSPEKITAVQNLLASPRVKPAMQLATRNAEVQAFLQRQYQASLGSNDWSFVSSTLKPSSEVASVETQEAILTGLISALSVSDQSESALDGLDQIARSNGALLKAQMANGQGSQLLPRLLLMEESPNDSIALKATNLSKVLVASSGQAETQSAAFDVVQQGLSDVSAESLPMYAVLEMTSRLQEGSKVSRSLLPDFAIWEKALLPFWSRIPPASISVINPLGGSVYSVEPTLATATSPIARDGEGNSQALRYALFVVNAFQDDSLFQALDEQQKEHVLYNLAMTVQLANDDLSIAGANKLCALHTAETEADLVDFVARAQQMLVRAMEGLCTEDQIYAFSSKVIDRWARESKGQDVFAYYNARAFEWAQSKIIEELGSTSSRAKEYLQQVQDHRKAQEMLPLAASLVAFGRTLWNDKLVDRYCNELVADLTGLDISSQAQTALQRLVAFNLLIQGEETAVSVVAKQRIIFCIKHLLPWLGDADVSTQVQSETYKALAVLLPGMADIYGEHWSEVLSAITKTWSAGFVSGETTRLDEAHLPLVHASLRLYGILRSLKASDDPNDDLVDAWKESEAIAAKGLVELLTTSQTVPDDAHQPLKITNELIAREITRLPTTNIEDPGELYPLLYTPSQSVQRTAFALLHKYIPSVQEQISFDAALEKKVAHLPEELLSLILSAPTLDSIVHLPFDRTVPTDLQGYLYSWLLIFDHFTNSSYAVKTSYIEELKESSYLPPLLDLIFDFLGHSVGKPISLSNMDITSYDPTTADTSTPERQTQHLLAHLYYLALTHLPSLTKSHFLSLTSRQTSLSLESWTAKHVSPLITSASLQAVADWAAEQSRTDPEFAEKMTVKVAMRAKEVNVSYLVDEQNMSIAVRLPETYPLNGARVEGVSRVAVDEKRWASWLRNCQGVITFSVSAHCLYPATIFAVVSLSIYADMFLRMAILSMVSRHGEETSRARSRDRLNARSATASSVATSSCRVSAAGRARTCSIARACTSGSRRVTRVVVRCVGMRLTMGRWEGCYMEEGVVVAQMRLGCGGSKMWTGLELSDRAGEEEWQ